MGHGATSVEQAGLGQQEGAGAERRGAPRPGSVGRQPIDQATVGKRRRHVQGARDHDGVDLGGVEL